MRPSHAHSGWLMGVGVWNWGLLTGTGNWADGVFDDLRLTSCLSLLGLGLQMFTTSDLKVFLMLYFGHCSCQDVF